MGAMIAVSTPPIKRLTFIDVPLFCAAGNAHLSPDAALVSKRILS
jgi:hypothetical protein